MAVYMKDLMITVFRTFILCCVRRYGMAIIFNEAKAYQQEEHPGQTPEHK